jgi:hypothetical protein
LRVEKNGGQEILPSTELGMEDGVIESSEHLLPMGEWGNKQQQDRKSVAGRLGVGGPPYFLNRRSALREGFSKKWAPLKKRVGRLLPRLGFSLTEFWSPPALAFSIIRVLLADAIEGWSVDALAALCFDSPLPNPLNPYSPNPCSP